MSRFKILWIDDQKAKCKRDVLSVSGIIKSLGFEPDIHVEDDISVKSLTDRNGTLNKAICARDVDLFVIDYNLKNELFGNNVVEEIRKNHDIYTDIVFYSSMSESLIAAVKESFDAESIMDYCDGVYIAPLGDEFIEKIKYVITKTIKSWYNVHSIRGIVLSKASKFEQMVSKIISVNYIHCLEEIKSKLDNKGDNVCRTIKEKWHQVKQTSDPVPQILGDPINFNWSVKKLMLQQLYNEKIVSISTWDDIEYIFLLRNKFAHNPIHLRDGVLVLTLKDKEETYTESEINSIRDAITRVEKNLSDIISAGGVGDADFGFSQGTEKELTFAK